MNKVNLHRIPSQPLVHNQVTKKVESKDKQSFLEHLQRATINTGNLKVSKHATERLAERNIHIPEQEWERISAKVDEANKKGIKESLVLTEQAAMIVSAKNRTVITAMDRTEAKDQLFTNIDGTIVLN